MVVTPFPASPRQTRYVDLDITGSEGAGAQQCAPATRLISSLLLNIALQGMEQAAGVRYDSRGLRKTRMPDRYHLCGRFCGPLPQPRTG